MYAIDWEAVVGFGLLAGLAVVYVAPAVLAIRWRHPRPLLVIAVNLLLGWTLVGWVAALLWVLRERHPGAFRRDDEHDPDAHLSMPRDVHDAVEDIDDD